MAIAPKFRAIVERNVSAQMRDGTTLYADIWRPDADGVFPVLLTRTPYDKGQPSLPLVAGLDFIRAVGEGYVVIVQDVRGRFASEGEWSFGAEFEDGYDTVEWAANLPFSNRNVGMFGISYLAYTQWMAAAARPPQLKAIFPQQMAGGPKHMVYRGGAFCLGSALFWAAGQLPDLLSRKGRGGVDITEEMDELLEILNNMPQAYERLPLGSGNSVVSTNFSTYVDWMRHVDGDEYWEPSTYDHRLNDVDIPVFHLGSWHDLYPADVPGLYARMVAGSSTQVRAKMQKLIMGPWVHGQMASDVISDLYMGFSATAAGIDLPGLQLRWFDHWLKSKDTGLLDEPPVKIFVMGRNVWRNEFEWPLARTRWTDFFLRSGGRANSALGDGRLDEKCPEVDEPPDSFHYDPARPVPTVGGPTVLPGNAIGANAGPKDQVHVETRDDVLVYSTPPLQQDIEVTGPIKATIFAATSARDTDWTVKLADVHPDGRSYNLADGIVRARYRLGAERPALPKQGQVYQYEIDLGAVSNVFKKGHRIRIQVSSSNFPRFSRNHNTGDDIETDENFVIAHQSILHNLAHPSRICLPIIEDGPALPSD